MKSKVVTIQIKATEQYFPVMLFIVLHKVIVVMSEAVDKIPRCDHLNETSSAVLSHGTFYIEVFYSMKFRIRPKF